MPRIRIRIRIQQIRIPSAAGRTSFIKITDSPLRRGSFHFIYGCSVWVSDGLGTWLVGWLADWLAGLLVASKEFRAPHTRTHLNSYHHHIYTIPCCMMGSRIGFTGLSKPQALNETRRNGACVPYADVHIFIYLFLLFNTLALTHPLSYPPLVSIGIRFAGDFLLFCFFFVTHTHNFISFYVVTTSPLIATPGVESL